MDGGNNMLSIIKDIESSTEKRIKDVERAADDKILNAVKNLQLDIEQKLDHKINNLKMDIVGLQNQHAHLDGMLSDLKIEIRALSSGMNKVSGNQMAINESVKHFSDTIKWILTIGGTLFLSLLTFVLYKGL